MSLPPGVQSSPSTPHKDDVAKPPGGLFNTTIGLATASALEGEGIVGLLDFRLPDLGDAVIEALRTLESAAASPLLLPARRRMAA